MRLLTGRFITTYAKSSPTLTSTVHLPESDLNLSVREVSPSDLEKPSSHLAWAGDFPPVVVFARNDRESFLFALNILDKIKSRSSSSPALLVANKADLSKEERDTGVVRLEDCHEAAAEKGSIFLEISAMEGPAGCRMLLGAIREMR